MAKHRSVNEISTVSYCFPKDACRYRSVGPGMAKQISVNKISTVSYYVLLSVHDTAPLWALVWQNKDQLMRLVQSAAVFLRMHVATALWALVWRNKDQLITLVQ